MARPERFELPTTWFVARYSIQLSYGRIDRTFTLDLVEGSYPFTVSNTQRIIRRYVAEREGFEPSMKL